MKFPAHSVWSQVARWLMLAAAAATVAVVAAAPARAQTNAGWVGGAAPIANDYNNGANWSPAGVPTGTATFGASSVTSIDINASTSVDGWTFNAGTYQFNLGHLDHFAFNNAGIVVNGGSVSINVAPAAELTFQNASTAGDASINISFGGGQVTFQGSSTAGNALIINNQLVLFGGTSTGGNAAITNNGNGIIDFSQSAGPGGLQQVSAGSISGPGGLFLGNNQLTVGGNGRDTAVSGAIADGGTGGGIGGSLVKVGGGTMILSGVNSYSGNTTVQGGTLQVDSLILSPLTTVANNGTLAGNGFIGGVVQVNSGGKLAPGGATGIVLTAGGLTFRPGAHYNIGLTPSAATSTNVSFTAMLGGATVVANFASGNYGTTNKQYTILTAGNISGTFVTQIQNNNLPANFTDSLSYDSNHVFLNLFLNFSLPNSGLNQN